MNLHVYRSGTSSRQPGLSIGVTPQRPRSDVRDDDVSSGGCEVWLPLLAPSRELAATFRRRQISFPVFARRYRAEMRQPVARQVIRLLAVLALRQRVNLGCSCKDESRCHHTILREVVIKAARERPTALPGAATYSSPACSMPEIDD